MIIKSMKNRFLLSLVCAGLTVSLLASGVQAAELTSNETAQEQKELDADISVFSDSGDQGLSGGSSDTNFSQWEGQDTPPVNDNSQPEPPVTEAPEPEPPQPSPPEPIPPEPEPPQPTPSEKGEFPIDGSGIIISREEMKNAIKTGEEFPVVISVKNTYENTKLGDIKLQFQLPQGLSMNAEQKTDTFEVKDIQPGQERKAKVKLISGNLPEGIPTLTMTVKMTYRYEEEGQIKSGKLEKNILLPISGDQGKTDENPGGDGGAGGGYGDGGGSDGGASGKKQIDPMTPNIIISQYDYGKDVKAGQEFTLKLVFRNTNKQTAIENLVMTVDAGEALSIEDSSNTTYVERMKPQETFTKEMKLRVLPQGQAENAKLEFNFKYEYLKKEERAQAASTEKMSIRFTQPDRFSIGDIQKEKEAPANEEATLSIPYVNKGKTTVYNMEARLVTDMSSEETYKFLGNVEAGTSGTIDFFVTPLETGNQKAKISVTYEDAEGNEKTVEKETQLTVTEGEADMGAEFAASMAGMEEDVEVNKAGFLTGRTVIPAAVAAVLVVTIVIVLRRRKKKRLELEEEEIL